MSKTMFGLFFLLVLAGFANAQPPIRVPVHATGQVANEFRLSIAERLKQDLANEHEFTKAQAEVFYSSLRYSEKSLQNRYGIYQGDAFSTWVQGVAAKVAAKANVSDYKIYVTKNAGVNCLSLPDGTIYMNIGLLSALKTEAQVAFVLGHEMAHIKRKHARKEFLRREKEEKNQKSRDLRLGLEYSKNNEFEADADGLNYIMAAGYASQEAVAALERLQAADSIYPEPALDFTSMMGKIPSDTSTDQHSNRNSGTTVVIVGQAAETKSSGTGSRDESDDTYSTHPYSSRRVEALKVLIRETERSTGKNTGTKGSGQYDAIHQAAMMESLWQQMQQGDYLEAFYKAAKEQQNAANPFQAAIMGQCLHWMATVKEADNFSVPDEGDVRGVGSSFLTFARQLEGIGPNALREWGYKYLDKLPEAYEDDEEFAFAKAMLTEAFTGTQTGKIVYRRFLDRFPQSDYAPFCQSKL